ncbi:MAG: sulfatase-like hydrolase/transferase, partial [Verrucomicrobiae bacterium]|nr:sulfatase-like hydrolase/transferase [Verrucomicrobiae bacterium]
MKLPFPISFSLLTFGFLCLSPMAAYAESRPNFIILIADDISFDDIGCYGSPNGRTPHIDALAKEGLRFTNAYL